MIRLGLGILLVCGVIVAAIAALGDPGSASLTWLGWRVDLTAAAGTLIVGLLALMATVFWRLVVWLLAAPARAAQGEAERRRRQGADALARGFLAVAAGDGAQARRLARRAADFSAESPDLVRILTAQAAEAADDHPAARLAYEAMLGLPDMRLAARRGLMRVAGREGDEAEALRQAALAHALPHSAPWAFRAIFEVRLAAGDWAGALTLVGEALDRRIISPIFAERSRAALQSAAAILEPGSVALERLLASARARPDFPAATVIAARRLAADDRAARGASLIELAWKARPHPALWMAWRDLAPDESPPERRQRLMRLADMTPDQPEARYLAVEAALIGRDFEGAAQAARALEAGPASRRLAGQSARTAAALNRPDEARAWIARAQTAPVDDDWSDIDARGVPFAFTPADWARVILAYADDGRLIHPRRERGEPTMSDLPRLAATHDAGNSFVLAAETGETAPPIVDDGVDDGDFADSLAPAGPGAPSPPWGFLGQFGGRQRRS